MISKIIRFRTFLLNYFLKELPLAFFLSFFLFIKEKNCTHLCMYICISISVYSYGIYIYIYILFVCMILLFLAPFFFFFSPLFVLTRNNKFVTTRDRGQTDEFRGRFRLLRVVLQPCHLCVQIRDNTRVVTSIRLHGTLYSDTQKSSGSGSFEAAA